MRARKAVKGKWAARIRELHPKSFFLATWSAVDAAAEQARLNRPNYDWRPPVVLCTGALFLIAMQYAGGQEGLYYVAQHVAPSWWPWLTSSPYGQLAEFAWWAGWRVLGYMVLPLLVLWVLRERLGQYFLGLAEAPRHAWMYALAYMVVLGAVVAVSFTDGFASYYPFYKLAWRSWFDLVAWELLYAAQFLSLEFFFRGYWLRACESSMGSHAVFASTVPYCMIHFGKPWAEAVAAIGAGVVLGTLALRTRSIWPGVGIHVAVALSMDLAVLLQTTGLPHTVWP